MVMVTVRFVQWVLVAWWSGVMTVPSLPPLPGVSVTSPLSAAPCSVGHWSPGCDAPHQRVSWRDWRADSTPQEGSVPLCGSCLEGVSFLPARTQECAAFTHKYDSGVPRPVLGPMSLTGPGGQKRPRHTLLFALATMPGTKRQSALVGRSVSTVSVLAPPQAAA